MDEYQRPPFFNCSSDAVGALSFGFGGSGSGVPFHTHGPVFAEVLYGAKVRRWAVGDSSRVKCARSRCASCACVLGLGVFSV